MLLVVTNVQSCLLTPLLLTPASSCFICMLEHDAAWQRLMKSTGAKSLQCVCSIYAHSPHEWKLTDLSF